VLPQPTGLRASFETEHRIPERPHRLVESSYGCIDAAPYLWFGGQVRGASQSQPGREDLLDDPLATYVGDSLPVLNQCELPQLILERSRSSCARATRSRRPCVAPEINVPR
jgi:hypothetical protein